MLSVDRKRKKDGRRLDRFYVIICINAMQLQVPFISHFLPVSSGFHFHTHAFRSLLRVFIAQSTVHVTWSGEILWVHTYPTTSSRPRGRCVQSLVPIGSEMWICIRYKHTNKQTFIFIYKINAGKV